MVKALIFDLDNCLAAADEVGEDLFEGAFQAIREANQGTLPEETLTRSFEDCWRHPLDWVAKRYGFSQAMLEAGWEVFSKLEIEEAMSGYENLAVLAELKAERFLVTSGFRLLQESKIRALGLKAWVTATYVDAIDEPDRKGKPGFFRQILEAYQFQPEEVLVIGDNAESEIAAGNEMGIRTVQTLRPGVTRSDAGTFHVQNLTELKDLLGKLE